jgi:LacI family transcriptional regulator
MTIYKIAEKANVSIATISRAINRETRNKVSSETLKRVDEIIRKCAYTPNRAAKNLVKTTYKTIGVLFPQHAGIFLENYYTQILAGISDTLIGNDYQMKLIMLQCIESKWDNYNFKFGEGIDGLVVSHWHAFFSDKSGLEKSGIPCVVISDPEKNVRARFVSGDNFQGGRLAAEHLYAQGHRKMAVLTGPPDSIDSRLRVEGFLSFLKKKGIKVNPAHRVSGEFQEEKAKDAVARLFQKKPDITAIFATNDNMARGAIRKLWEFGLACPKDISVVGYDDDKMAAAFEPPLTTIHVPLYELAVQACRNLTSFLSKQMGKDEFYTASLLPVHLVVRKSVRRIG